MSIITGSRQAPLSMRILPTSALSQLFSPSSQTEQERDVLLTLCLSRPKRHKGETRSERPGTARVPGERTKTGFRLVYC